MMDNYYTLYVNARARFWYVHDKLWREGEVNDLDELKAHPLYQKAERVVERAYQRWKRANEL